MRKNGILRGLEILYRHGVRAIVGKIFRRGECPEGTGALYFCRYWVHRIGKIWPVPSFNAFLVKKRLDGVNDVDIVVTHGWGGGAETYLRHKIRKISENRAVFVAHPSTAGGTGLEASLYFRGKTMRFIAGGLAVFEGLKGKKCRIVLNELARWPRIGDAVGNKTAEWLADNMLALKHFLGAEMVYLLHDYYCICPKLTLAAPDGFYCHSEVSMTRCEKCLKVPGPLPLDERVISVSRWRQDFVRLLSGCERVIAFSDDTKQRVHACYPNLEIETIPHELPCVPSAVQAPKGERPAIGIVGNLYREKGLPIVQTLAGMLWNANRRDVAIKIAGTIPKDVEMPPNVKVLGEYDVSELPAIVRRAGINVMLFPSLVPETFSYVTKELIALGLPVACFDLGAQRDHVKAYVKGAIIPEMTAESAWKTIEMLYGKEYGTCP